MKEWCLLSNDRALLHVTNRILTILQQAWIRNAYQLIPSLFPPSLASFLWHPEFQEVARLDDYVKWKQEALDKFRELGKGRQMYSCDKILKIGCTGKTQFQYRQVKNLVCALMKCNNVFRPLTSFEMLLSSNVEKKHLSKLYQFMASTVHSVDNIKSKWEKELGLNWIDKEWDKLKQVNYSCSRNVGVQDIQSVVFNTR